MKNPRLLAYLILAVSFFLTIAWNTSWAEPIRLSITPTPSLLHSQEQSASPDTDQPGRKITFRLNIEKKAELEIDVYNAAGKRVATIKKIMPAGPGTLVWNCASVPPGTFQARVKVDGKETKSKISLVK